MKKLLLFLFILSITLSISAQERFDLFYLAGNYNFMQTSADDAENNHETAFMAQLKIPVVFKNDNVWYNQIDYQYFLVNNEHITTSPFESMEMHGIILRTGYVHRLSENTSIQALLSPRLMTDFSVSVSDAIQWGGILMYENTKKENFLWKVGVLYNQDFFGPYVVPVFDINWKITEKLRLSGLLPVYGAFYMETSEKFQAGLHFIGLTTSYKISETDFENIYVDRRSIDLSLFTKVYMFNNMFFTARAGYSLSRKYDVFHEDDKMDIGFPLVNVGDDRTKLNNEFDGSPFIHLRMTYSIQMK